MALDVLMTPRQLGPSTRMPCLRAISPTRCSSSAPFLPVSLNPAVMTTATFTPFSPASSMTWGTAWLGTVMTAISTSPGIEETSGNVLRPRMLSAFGFTGYSAPR